MSNNFPISDVVKIIVQDSYLVEHKDEFAGILRINAATRGTLKNLCNMDCMPNKEYFTRLLEDWVGPLGKEATLTKLYDILEAGKFKSAADKLKQLDCFLWEEKLSNNGLDLPSLTKLYVGRTHEEQKILDDKNIANGIIIHGQYGIGKTQLVLKTFNENRVYHFLRGDSIINLRDSLEKYARLLGCPTKKGGMEKSFSDLFKSVCRKMYGKDLVTVIDGLNILGDDGNELRQEIKKVIECCSTLDRPKPFLVITTLRKDLIHLEVDTFSWSYLELLVFTDEEAETFVRRKLPIENSTDIKQLNKELGNYPIAINQAVESIKRLNYTKPDTYSIKNYLSDYRRMGSSITLEFEEIGVPKSMVTIVKMIISQLKNSEGPDGILAVQMLELLAFIDGDGISLENLENISRYWQGFDPNKVKNSVDLLYTYSFISCKDSRTVFIHRVVQNVLQFYLRKLHATENMEKLPLLDFFAKLPSEFISSSQSRLTHLGRMWTIFSHRYLNIGHSELHGIANQIYFAYEKFGLFSQAKSFIFKQKEIFANQLGDENLNTLRIQKSCGIAMRNLGEFIQAEKIFKNVHAQQDGLLGNKDPETLDTEHWIVSMFWRRKMNNEAEIAVKNLINKCRDVGEKEIEMKATQVLAFILGDNGDTKGSFDKHLEVWEWRRKKFGDNHSDTVAALHNLAHCKYQLRKYNEAFLDFSNILEKFHQFRTPADTLKSEYWKIMCESKMTDLEGNVGCDLPSCITKLKQLYENQKKLGFDKKHPDILRTLESIKVVERQLDIPAGGIINQPRQGNLGNASSIVPAPQSVLANVRTSETPREIYEEDTSSCCWKMICCCCCTRKQTRYGTARRLSASSQAQLIQ